MRRTPRSKVRGGDRSSTSPITGRRHRGMASSICSTISQRELIVENTRAGLAAARKRGRRGGRPPVLDKEGIRVAEAMLKDTMNYPFVGDVIDRLGIGRTAFYRYFPPDRIRELRNQT